MFWIGLAVGIALTVVVWWLKTKNISLKWYEWILGVLGMLSLFATVQHYFGSLREYEVTSAWMGALIFGIMAIILLTVTWQLVLRRAKKI
ncbi:dehalogenase [Dehalococcoides mccartyi CG1]|jgi:heme/copper-type cytochrome/quinol oxidase subunit 4|uniref:hypothetical protein n=1 Tax=Dehalococcoides mccartyi TaxID=61435 RepID=UPI0004E07124|nr:hypothetical protein [Dehalococcoides mccartyi]AII58445.1 dehalogenase [Dehalococcoides mccartyi CG1]